MSGRTGFLIFPILLLVYTCFSLYYRDKTKFLIKYTSLASYSLFTISLFLIAYKLFFSWDNRYGNDGLLTTLQWAFGEFIDFNTNRYSDKENWATLKALFGSHVYFPESFHGWLLGESGSWISMNPHGDMGYIRILYTNGLLGSFLLYGGYFSIFVLSFWKARKKFKILFVVLFIYLYVAEIKEPFFLKFSVPTVCLLLFMYVMKVKQKLIFISWIFLLIDSLGSGGAQRQLVNIASCLSDRGHIVDVCIYNPHINFFEKRLKDKGVKVLICDKRVTNKISFIKSIYSILYSGRYEIAMSFLDKPNLILELISKFVNKTVFIACERSSYVGFYNHNSFFFKGNFRGFFHSLVDHVLTNSNTQMKWVKTRYPYLKNKTSCIYNGFEICNEKVERIRNNNTRLKLLAVGRTSPEKNIINLIHGLNLFLQKNKWLPSISWVVQEIDQRVLLKTKYTNR